MKLLRNVNGETLVRHLERRWDYVRISQSGSHIKMRTQIPTAYSVIIPAHKPVKPGTLHFILSEVARHRGVAVSDVAEGL